MLHGCGIHENELHSNGEDYSQNTASGSRDYTPPRLRSEGSGGSPCACAMVSAQIALLPLGSISFLAAWLHVEGVS